ncbi:MAG TPA: hypothetical protein VI006_15685 [Solirubrobacteraceae bacterium]
MKRSLAAVAGVVMSVALTASASAFTPPELFVRMQTWNTHEAAGDWIPLASAPAVNYLGGYQVGYKLQDSGVANDFQRVALTITGAPDGQPTQPLASPPYCVGRAGTEGTIVDAGPELQFEGDGTYTVKVSVGPGSGGPMDCLSEPSATTASFRVDVHVAPVLVGAPLSFRAMPLPGNPFVGVRAAAPPGGDPDVSCAPNGTVRPDGSITGSVVVPSSDFAHPTVAEGIFPRPGVWRCVARGVAEGRDANLDTVEFGTPWSAPLTLDVRSDFRRKLGTVSKRAAKRPRFTFKAEWPGAANGGRGTVTVFRIRGCKGSRFKLRKVGSFRGRFGRKHMRLTIRRPRAAGFYIGRFKFSGTRFLRAGVDPNPVLLQVSKRRMGFADPRGFPHCP